MTDGLCTDDTARDYFDFNVPLAANISNTMELETINKLYLELSQIATAKTKSELLLDDVSKSNFRRMALLTDIFNCDIAEQLPVEIKNRIAKEIDA